MVDDTPVSVLLNSKPSMMKSADEAPPASRTSTDCVTVWATIKPCELHLIVLAPVASIRNPMSAPTTVTNSSVHLPVPFMATAANPVLVAPEMVIFRRSESWPRMNVWLDAIGTTIADDASMPCTETNAGITRLPSV